jgi:long-chain acyl-CoA synthetase
VHGATTLNLASIIDRHARLQPDRQAIVCQGVRLTYGRLNEMIVQVASGLRARGIGPGDHVALSCPNIAYFPVVYFGILRAGATVVPLNVLFKPPEIAYHLRDADATAYFCFEGTPELPMAAMGKAAFDGAETCRHFIVVPHDPTGAVTIDGATSYAQFISSQPAACPVEPCAASDTAVVLYTSGTTGRPKGAELTHLNIMLNAAISGDLMLAGMRADPHTPLVALVTLPLFHSFGQVCQMMMGVYNGMTLVLVPRFDPHTVLETFVNERVNSWAGVPTMYWTLLQYVSANQIDVRPIAEHLRLCLSGGGPMPVEVLKTFEATFGVRILEGYGLSETSPVATFNHVERPSKPGTVGQPILGVEVACVNDRDEPVRAGERGEVVIRGHNIMKGYYKRPEATAEVLRGGWFHTGDIGILDEDGYLSIVDRKKDMIVRGGFNVYPRELEEILMTHPAVSLCAVIGVRDERLGEEVKAFIVPRPGAAATEAEIVTWCRDRMAAYKAPRYVEFRDCLPMGATGKVLKRELRADYAEQVKD